MLFRSVNRFPGMPEASAMLGISTLIKEGKVWAMARDTDELSNEDFMKVAIMMLEYSKELQTKLPERKGFSETQLERLEGQLMALQIQYEEVIAMLEDPEEYARIMEERMAEKLSNMDDEDPFSKPLDHYVDNERPEPNGSESVH